MVATILFTVRELIFHDWHPTNPGSELGMSKSMTKTVTHDGGPTDQHHT